jgi:hypothetical protein
MADLVPIQRTDLEPAVDRFSAGLTLYLENLGLPKDNVLVEMVERAKVIKNLPDVVAAIPAQRRPSAMYVSKFIAACAAGLFDAALNYLWDETVVNLREKVVRFDLDYFYDSAIESEERRKSFRTEEDLAKLDEWELIRGCRQIGILSIVGFKHLDYIRDMRNWASAAHPNHAQLTGLQLVSWLETCIKEVLAKGPEGPGVEARTLLHNLRNETLTKEDASAVVAAIQKLPGEIVLSVARTVFGMFVDPKVVPTVKDNIRLIAPGLWDAASDDIRNEIGVRYGTYSANGDVTRKAAAKEFLDRVNGLSYLPTDTLSVEINERLDNLMTAHYGWNNFHNEPAHARSLEKYISPAGSVPTPVLHKYVKTLVLCRAGNGSGDSWAAVPYYDQLIAKFQEREIHEALKLLGDNDLASRLRFPRCQRNYRGIVASFKAKTTNSHLLRAIEMIEKASENQLPNLGGDSRYRTAVGSAVL